MSASMVPPDRRSEDEAVTEAAARLAAIVEAAEKAAASVIDDAEDQARQRIGEAQARADRIVAERLRQLADELDPPGQADRPQERPRLRTVEADEGPSHDPSASPRRPGEAGARLLATQMAVSGASRGEIADRLRGAGIDDPSSLLDAILGPEG